MQSNNNLTIYNSWKINYPAAPSRSRLFPLEPSGLGTPYVESLTSYLTRLAEAHNVLVGDLVAKEIKTIVPKKYKSKDLFCTKHKSGTANSTGKVAKYLLSALSSLTFRQDLKFLTLTQWSQVLPQRNLIHPTKNWCPLCYQEQYQNNRIIYDPLIWFLKPLEACPVHKIKLQSKCPHCGESLPSLARNSQSGYCSNCEQWLGQNNRNDFPAGSEWDLSVAKNVGELLVNAVRVVEIAKRENISKSFQRCLDQANADGIRSFTKLVGFKKNQVWEWTNGKVIPEFTVSLKISYLMGVSLFDFLSGAEFQCLNYRYRNSPIKHKKSNNNNKIIDLELAEQKLLKILSDSPENPCSMSEVAKQIGCHRRTLTRRFPKLTHQISARYQQYKQETHARKIKEYCQEVEKAVMELNQKGIYPSEVNVSKLISKPGSFREKEVRDALRKARQKLGMRQ
ncbi:MAG: TniQ family protein [Xenococcaceae cyanobacterium MO_207.B15]|nr:TniQ family protein [Xenococcaceae cyanobacterium MO_207.B15]